MSGELALVPFDFMGHPLRTVQVDGATWFVASDAAEMLGYSRTPHALRMLDADMKGVQIMDTLGGRQRVSIVSEGGLWRLTQRSQRPEAKAIELWVVNVVLPAIARTGSYSVSEQPPAGAPALPMSYREAVAALLAELEAKEALELELSASESARAELEPRAGAWDDLVSAEGDYLVGDAAKMLSRIDGIDTGQNRLYKYMASQGWVYRSTGKRAGHGPWRIYQTSVERGWLTEKISTGTHVSDGVEVANPPQVRVTVKGLERLRSMMLAGKQLQRA